MRTCRRAYALIEMLGIITAFALIMALSAAPMRTLLSEIPKADKNYQVWIQTMQMLGELRHDVEHAAEIKLSEMDSDAGGHLLLLKTPSGLVQYTIMDEHVIRELSTEDEVEQVLTEWKLPRNKISMELWSERERPLAVEVTTWTQDRAAKPKRNFLQTYVFFRAAK